MKALQLFGVLLVVGCADSPSQSALPVNAGPTMESAAPNPTARPFRPGIRFDPATLRRGMRVGSLIADSVSALRTAADSTFVGIARFRGQIELTGKALRHPDTDLVNTTSCFEADSASASLLPRWTGDERRPWFCFVNQTDARRALGRPIGGVDATIVVDAFTIHRGLSDQVNTARFVRRSR